MSPARSTSASRTTSTRDYQVPGLGSNVSVNGHPGTLWLTQQHRVDKDYAMFGEASYDLTPTVTLTAGGRVFIYDNTLIGFFGFGRNPGNGYTDTPYNGAGSSRTGVAACFTDTGERLRDALANGAVNPTLLPPAVAGGPCTNLGVYAGGVRPVRAQGSGVTYRFNATWKPDQDLLLYATWSRGFRPGGINRRGDFGPYQLDYLVNYEVGAKATLLGGALRINGAIYQQDWKHFQFSYLGPNSFTIITNGPNARIRGAELDANLTTGGLALSATGAYVDAKTRQNLCAAIDPTFTCSDPGNFIQSPVGTRLPITPRWKFAGTARYTVPLDSVKVYGQVNATYQSSASSDVRVAFANAIGRLADFATVNLALGAEWDAFRIEGFVANVFDERGQLSRFVECGSCTQRPYIVPITPRTFGIRVGADF